MCTRMSRTRSTTTTVLVCFGKRNREVCFQENTREAIEEAIRDAFKDVLKHKDGKSLILQMKSDKWSGMFVEISDYNAVVEGSIIEVVFDEMQCTTIPTMEDSNQDMSCNGTVIPTSISCQQNGNQISLSSVCGKELSSDKFLEEVRQQAIIFRKEPLSDYQTKVNEAAFKIALSQPNLLQKGQRGILLENARKKVADEGYTFKKGVSRSKVYGNPATCTSKSRRLNHDLRQERMLEINEELTNITAQLTFKNKRIIQAELIKDYKLCDRLTDEIQDCNIHKRELENELKLLNQKERKSKKRLNLLKEKTVRSSTPIFTSSSIVSSSPGTSICSSGTSSSSIVSSSPATSICSSDQASSIDTSTDMDPEIHVPPLSRKPDNENPITNHFDQVFQ